MPIPAISQVIKNRRLELRLSMEQVAKGIGVNRSTVCRWEKGNVNGLKRAHIYLLSKILYLPIDMLLVGNTEENIEEAEVIRMRLKVIDELDLVKDKEGLEQVDKFIRTFVIKK